MGLRDRLKKLGGPSREDVPLSATAQDGAARPDVEARLAALDAMHRRGSMSDRELQQAKQRILDGKD